MQPLDSNGSELKQQNIHALINNKTSVTGIAAVLPTTTLTSSNNRKINGTTTTTTISTDTTPAITTTSFTINNPNGPTNRPITETTTNPFKQQHFLNNYQEQQQQSHERLVKSNPNGNTETENTDGQNNAYITDNGAKTTITKQTDVAATASIRSLKSKSNNTRATATIPTPNDQDRQEDYRAAGSFAAIKNWVIKWRGSRRLVLIIVAIALLLDNMLLTIVVPIIPEFLYDMRHPDAPLESYPRTPLTTHTQSPPTENPRKDGIVITSTLSPQEILENETMYREMEERHKELVGETVEVGLLFASKAFVQLLVNPIVGPLTHRIGYSIPMFIGFIVMFLSTIIFAFGRSYLILFIARALQGIGSSFSSVSGMGMLADRYTDDKERGNAMGIALGGLALGVLIGPPFGGVMYEFVGKSAPFLILSILALGDGMLQLLMLQPSVQKAETDPPTLKALITDPYILVAAGSITFANMGIAMLEPSLPLWMVDNMGSSRWEQGVAFLPASISYLIGTNLFGPLGHKIGRWLAACLGLLIIGCCLILIPLATSITHLIVPNAGLGFAIGMVDSSMMPELGYLVDIRHSAVYGSVYALGDVAFCVGFAVGPALGGTLVKEIGFEWMLFGIAIICFLYAPLLTLLKNPPTREEKKVGTNKQTLTTISETSVITKTTATVTATTNCTSTILSALEPSPQSSNILNSRKFIKRSEEDGLVNRGFECERL